MHHLAKFTKFNWLLTLIDLQYITATATSLGLMSCNPHKQQGQWCSRSSRENSKATFAQVFSKWRLLQRSPQLWKHCNWRPQHQPSTENTKLIATNIFGSNCFIVCLELVLYTIYSSFLVHASIKKKTRFVKKPTKIVGLPILYYMFWAFHEKGCIGPCWCWLV